MEYPNNKNTNLIVLKVHTKFLACHFGARQKENKETHFVIQAKLKVSFAKAIVKTIARTIARTSANYF